MSPQSVGKQESLGGLHKSINSTSVKRMPYNNTINESREGAGQKSIDTKGRKTEAELS